MENGAKSRLEKWSAKLLDFSARNRLLNMPQKSRQLLELLCADTGGLEDSLSSGQTVRVRSLEEAVDPDKTGDLAAGTLPEDEISKILVRELAHHRLCVRLSPRETRRRMNELYHDARTSLEEGGVNTLFLAIGSLKWREGESKDAKFFRAPVLMVPVGLERASMAEGVKLRRLDEDTVLNTTLMEFLKSQFGIVPEGLDELPQDENGTDVALVFKRLSDAVSAKDGWEVLDEVHLGCFSFAKFVMWKDMTARMDELEKNPLVRHLAEGGGLFDDGIEVFPPEELAANLDPYKVYCPLPADSSQLTAVLYSALGKTFVLHGPPGTGKSQTIANMIAHNLAIGRRVLFVSEKKAALDVVKSRLDKIGLSPFCLELHSNKTEKSRFYAQLKEALEVADCSLSGEWEKTVSDKTGNRDGLDAYVKALHRKYPCGITPYEAFSRVIAAPEKPDASLVECDATETTADGYSQMRNAVSELLDDFRAADENAIAALPGFTAPDWSPAFERKTVEAAQATAVAAEPFAAAFREAVAAFGLSAEPDEKESQALAAAFGEIGAIAAANASAPFTWSAPEGGTPSRFLSALALKKRHLELAASLPGYRLETTGGVDFDGAARRLRRNNKSFFLFRFFKNRALAAEFKPFRKPGAEKLDSTSLKRDLPLLGEYHAVAKEFAETAKCSIMEFTPLSERQRKAMSVYLSAYAGFVAKRRTLFETVDGKTCGGSLDDLATACKAVETYRESIRGVMRYRASLERAAAAGAGRFGGFIERNDDGALDAGKAFDEAFAAKFLEELLEEEPVFASFNAIGREAAIERFRRLEKRCTALAKDVVYAKLAAMLPRRRKDACPEGSELGMLKRECEKKTRQKAPRKLLAASPNLVPALKRCFLMSPLSVAQYLSVDSGQFDLVVFDEASQIPVWDAIGVIARGRQLVVVGDPKQMPPTNFFQKGETDDGETDESDDVSDQESILDECLVAGVFSARLNWHYRSRHESLIAFSNEHYYDSRLCTFPAASDAPYLGVKFVFVDRGVWESSGKGTVRTNPVEAKALVDYLAAKVKEPGRRPRSVGIVVFSLPQQRLVRTLIEERRSQDPELERLLPEEGEGAYFVKNLENVQGDESDVILFSVGFAPDETGKMSMNFGPLNRAGGERRLNVAITRAKEQVVVFSSIHASQIDAGEDGRVKSTGAAHLKAFLEYAEACTRPAACATVSPGVREDSSFPRAIARFLKSKGYAVERNVGTSMYRIDLGVKRNAADREYVLGVECDGAPYAAQRTAQDRDVNRPGVLAGLGWRLARAWSADWALDRAQAEERLLAELDGARDRAAESQVQEKAVSAFAPHAKSGDSPYLPYRIFKTRKTRGRDDFYSDSFRAEIYETIAKAVECEGPVCESLLRERVAAVYGLARITDKAARVLDISTPRNLVVTVHGGMRVLWPKDAIPENFTAVRVPDPEDGRTKRQIDEIPPEELANAMRLVVRELGECRRDDLYREVLRIFGLTSLTAKAREILDSIRV